MWSDNESDVDLLRFRYLASTVTKVVSNPNLLPTTLGLYGDWGSGKSTLLKMVKADLEKQEGVLCLSFNGWLFEGYEDAKTALMGSILDAIQDKISANEGILDKAKPLLEKLRKRVNWLQFLTLTGRYVVPSLLGQPHLSAVAVAQDVAKKIYDGVKATEKEKQLSLEDIAKLVNSASAAPENIRRDIRDFHRDFQQLIQASGIETLVVFIDDLDRCLPDTVIETLEAIKLFLFVPGTAFVLGADERLIEYAVRRRFPELPGTATEVGRDYLEKLVQIPVRIPPLGGSELHSYLNLLFAQLRLDGPTYTRVCEHASSGAARGVGSLWLDVSSARELIPPGDALAELENDLDFTAQVAPVISPVLGGSPRRAKRFLNTLLLRLELGGARGLDLRRPVLAKLMLLEYLKPEFFKQLANLQAAQDGIPSELGALEAFVRYKPAPVPAVAPSTGKERSPDPATGQAPTVKSPSRPEVPELVGAWMADDWTLSWLLLDPTLGNIDLRPYFYIAHDRIGGLAGTTLRLSPAASQVLEYLLSEQSVTRTLGARKSEALTAPDAAAVFEALALKVRQAERLDTSGPQGGILDLVQHRPELLPQLISLYSALPDGKITLVIPTKLFAFAVGTPSAEAVQSLVTRWSQSSESKLVAAAVAVLARKEK